MTIRLTFFLKNDWGSIINNTFFKSFDFMSIMLDKFQVFTDLGSGLNKWRSYLFSFMRELLKLYIGGSLFGGFGILFFFLLLKKDYSSLFKVRDLWIFFSCSFFKYS